MVSKSDNFETKTEFEIASVNSDRSESEEQESRGIINKRRAFS